MQQRVRTGEAGAPPERKDRFFQKDGYWYYHTREGVDIGPFDCRDDAEDGCMEFKEFVCGEAPEFSETLVQYRIIQGL